MHKSEIYCRALCILHTSQSSNSQDTQKDPPKCSRTWMFDIEAVQSLQDQHSTFIYKRILFVILAPWTGESLYLLLTADSSLWEFCHRYRFSHSYNRVRVCTPQAWQATLSLKTGQSRSGTTTSNVRESNISGNAHIYHLRFSSFMMASLLLESCQRSVWAIPNDVVSREM